MDLLKHNTPIPEEYRNATIVIGNFDGMHKGHHALIQKAAAHAKASGTPLGMLTFEPHPRTVFQPKDSAFRITPSNVKREKVAETGIDFLIELDFTRDLAQKSAEAFVQDILIDHIGAKQIFIGNDFHFGQNRAGSAKTIKDCGIAVTSVHVIEDAQNQKYSASHVRSHLRRGMIEDANNILGWDWEIRGTVIHGDKRGREMGFPTANVPLGDTINPAFGVYATMVRIEGEELWRPAATNIGIRPMFETTHALAEAFLFDFDGDLYDKTLHIRPVQKIRDEARYDSLDELIVQIEKDCDNIRTILNLEKPL